MEDGIERMMTSELYNIHFLNENENKKKFVKELTSVKELKEPISITKIENKVNLKDVKESSSTNPQLQV